MKTELLQHRNDQRIMARDGVHQICPDRGEFCGSHCPFFIIDDNSDGRQRVTLKCRPVAMVFLIWEPFP